MLLYKYLPAKRVDVLINKKIRFSPPDRFNDPFEMNPPCDLYESLEEARQDRDRRAAHHAKLLWGRMQGAGTNVSEVAIAQMLIDQDEQQVAELGDEYLPILNANVRRGLLRITEMIGALSLSSNYEALTMWAHYAEDHRGYVLGLDSTHSFLGSQTPNGIFGELAPVKYQQIRQPLKMHSFDVRDWLYSKSTDWEYEAEWRSIRMLPQQQTNGLDRTLFDLPPDAIKVIKLGARIETETRDDIFKALQALKLPSDFVCEQAELDPNEYKLVFKPVDFRHVQLGKKSRP